jgi:hypothetical protein
MKNFTVGHEMVQPDLEYPDNHIEINPQFRKCVLELYTKYPKAKFVHLIRPKKDCVPSLAALNFGKVMECYFRLHVSVLPSPDALDVAGKFWDWENRLISTQLRLIRDEQKMKIWLNEAKQMWHKFWDWIGAEGNFKASLNEWNTPRNTRVDRNEVLPDT